MFFLIIRPRMRSTLFPYTTLFRSLTATTSVTNVLCNGASTGSVVITPSGGVVPYTITPAQTGLAAGNYTFTRSEEHTSELQSQSNLVCRLLLEKKKRNSISSGPVT